MALAMGRKQTLNGYFFVDVHHRFSGNRKHAIDYQSQWAVAAIPADMPKSGFLVFLADESGKVYAKSFTARPTKFPVLPLEAGWRAVASETDLGGEF